MDKIKVAFCFDENLITQVQVAIASLLDFAQDENVHYDIYCIYMSDDDSMRERLERIVAKRDKESSVQLICVDNPYKNSYEIRGISSGAYLRLVLHQLLPMVKRILYMDVDVLVRGNLLRLWKVDLCDNFLAAVKAAVNLSDKWEWNSERFYWKLLEGQKSKYINSGVMLLNLEEIRNCHLEVQWNELAKEKLYYQDQDIINITCRNKILHLAPKYNRLAYMSDEDYNRFVEEGIYTVQECKEAVETPVIIHYAGDKPWKRYDTNLGSIWWDYVNSQTDLKDLFDEEKARSYHGPSIWQRLIGKCRRMFSKEKL
ncbi:MAG: glycosyltransferase family 8 protein [Lachnospiraceae bacterium]|nr:glycosyltransferase family 8 protein [Lachnospiraceae bacterium]